MKSIHEEITDADLSAGTNTLSSTVTLQAKINKITDLAFSYTGTVTSVRIEIKAGGKRIFKTIADPTSGQTERISNLGNIFLSGGEKIEMVITDATATDDATLIVHGVELRA